MGQTEHCLCGKLRHSHTLQGTKATMKSRGRKSLPWISMESKDWHGKEKQGVGEQTAKVPQSENRNFHTGSTNSLPEPWE